MITKDRKILVIGNEMEKMLVANSKYNVDYQIGYKEKNLIGRILRHVWHNLHFPGFCHQFLALDTENLNTYDLIIILEGLYSLDMIRYIRKYNLHCRLILWLWNSSKGMTIHPWYNEYNIFLKEVNPKIRNKLNYEIWSFDHKDCQNYHLKSTQTFCVKYDDLESVTPHYDVTFLGGDKGRLSKLKHLADAFSKMKINYNIKVIPDKKRIYSEIDKTYLMLNTLPYREFLKKELEGKCFLEILQEGQADVSWRALEAQFYKRKLITNCKNIKSYAFYMPNNIFILGQDNINDLRDFLNSPYKEIDDLIVRRYQFDGWLDKI